MRDMGHGRQCHQPGDQNRLPPAQHPRPGGYKPCQKDQERRKDIRHQIDAIERQGPQQARKRAQGGNSERGRRRTHLLSRPAPHHPRHQPQDQPTDQDLRHEPGRHAEYPDPGPQDQRIDHRPVAGDPARYAPRSRLRGHL